MTYKKHTFHTPTLYIKIKVNLNSKPERNLQIK